MSDVIWELPVPATSLSGSPVFTPLTKRQCELTFSFEGEEQEEQCSLLFTGVEAYKCTYLTSCSADMFRTAYGKLVDLGSTTWLRDVLVVYTRSTQSTKKLRHFMIC